MAAVIGGLANYALGAGMKLAGNAMVGGANIAASLGGSTVGTSAIKGFGGVAGGLAAKGIANVLTGNGPVQRRKKARAEAAAAASSPMVGGGCSCGEKPKYSCEEKCAYGRYMAEKCKGCSGSRYRSKYKYSRPYRSSSRYSGTPRYSNSMTYNVGNYGKPRVEGRQARRYTRTAARQERKTQRQANRQYRKANRQARRSRR